MPILPGKIFRSNQPAHLLKAFVIFSSLSLVFILIFVSIGIRMIIVNHSVKEAEHVATAVSKAFFEDNTDMLLERDSEKGAVLHVKPENFLTIKNHLKSHLTHLDIMKVKIISKDAKVVYSTDYTIIDQVDRENKNLQKALRGEVISFIKQKDSVSDIKGETRYDVDMVEIYVPIKESDGTIIGSFEVYLDITRYRKGYQKVLKASLAVVSCILVFVFGFLYILMKQGTRQLSMAQEELRKSSVTDALTGVFNRGHLMTRAREELSKISRFKGKNKPDNSLGCIMIDIDHFKIINDTYGHIAGDEVLKKVVNRMKACIREYDVIGRYGGEEFLILLPGTGIENTRVMAARIWESVREKPFTVKGSSIKVTISLGVACPTTEIRDVDSILNKADEGLYKAKRDGRDRVVCA